MNGSLVDTNVIIKLLNGNENNDILIAAIAIFHQRALITFDSHFVNIEGLILQN